MFTDHGQKVELNDVGGGLECGSRLKTSTWRTDDDRNDSVYYVWRPGTL